MRTHRALSILIKIMITTIVLLSVSWSNAFAACVIKAAGTYIEAENFSSSTNTSGTANQNFSLKNITGTNGGQVLEAGAAGSGVTAPVYEVKNYKVTFETAGTYYMWIRGKAFGGSSNSMFFGLGGSGYKAWTLNTDNSFIWSKAMHYSGDTNTLTIAAAGEYTINIAMREGGTQIDGFFLTTSSTTTPTDATVPSSVTEADPTDCSTSGTVLCDINSAGTYIEAEHFTSSTNTNSDADKNLVTISDSNANGTIALEAGDDGTASSSPSYEVKNYRVNFPTAGTYNFWMRGKAFNGSEDSMFYTIDNQSWRAWNFDGVYNTYIWTNHMQVGSNQITVAAGEHTIKIAMREKDTRIDAFYLTTGSETPTDASAPANVAVVDPNNCSDSGRFSVDPPSLGPTNFLGYNASSNSFTITNTGTKAITDVTISGNQSWLSASPSTISSLAVNESVTVQVNYSTSGVAAGTHSANITVASSSSSNSPTVQVTLLVKTVPSTAACGEIPLYAENLVNPAIMVQLDTSGSMSSSMYILASGENPSTPDLSAIVKEIVDLPGWQSGNSMSFVISGTGKRRAWTYDGQSNGAPKLFITYTHNSTTEEISNRVGVSAADVQIKSGNLNTSDSYLELGRASNPVGLRFSGVAVPAGATIVKAEIKFLIYSGHSDSTNLTVNGIKLADAPDLTKEALTATTDFTSSVAWNTVESWNNTMSRIAIAEDVLKEVFLDRSISWGFATWAGGSGGASNTDSSGNNYTNYRIGIHDHDSAHQTALQDKADDGNASGYTPLAPTMQAANDYFSGNRTDSFYNETYSDLSCQPKILVLVTDGLGNTGTTLALAKQRTNELIAAGITVVVVGFGIDNASQIIEIAKLAQAAGKTSDEDYLYPLHDEDADGVGLPFLAQSREDFINAMNSIVTSVKAQVFHGAAPAPTTSADDGELLLTATFDASNWTGNITATKFDAFTGALDSTTFWSAINKMPSTGDIKGFIYDATETDFVSAYTSSSLATDNFLCKPLGDIINSTPKIVAQPAYRYSFDSYRAFKYNHDVNSRDPLVYVNANDGALHAFLLKTGIEKWRFYPGSVVSKLNAMGVDPTKDMCSSSYCHDFLNDGSPQVDDIYNGSSWKTILTSGLGQGGKAYFALDITYANDFDAAVNPSAYLWEFTATDDSQIGLATSLPQTMRVEKYTGSGATWTLDGSSWVTYIGSGPEETDSLQSNKESYLYAMRSWDKAMVWRTASTSSIADTYKVKLETGTLLNDIPSAPLIINVEEDDDMNDRIYLGNRYGDMFKVSNIGENEIPLVEKIFDSANTDHSTPIVSKGGYAFAGDPDHDQIEDIWVYFGTGKYDDQLDKISNYQQYFFGLFDEEGSTSPAYEMDDLVQVTTGLVQAYALDENGDPVDLNNDTTVDSDDLITIRTVDCDAADKDSDGNCNPSELSWVLKLLAPGTSASERVLSRPLVVGGIVFFTTFIPDGDVCEGNGDAYLFALDWKTGSARSGSDVVFDINGDGVFDDSDATVKDPSGQEYDVIGLYIGEGKPSDPVLHNDVIFVGTTGEPPKPIKVNIPGLKARLKAWKQILN